MYNKLKGWDYLIMVIPFIGFFKGFQLIDQEKLGFQINFTLFFIFSTYQGISMAIIIHLLVSLL
jgi:hypothetical protein